MRFRQKSILFWEIKIVISICLIVCIILMVYDRLFISALLIPSTLLVGVFLLQLVLGEEYIIMNEEGISCEKHKHLCWKYEWSEIEKLEIGNRFHNPSVEIVLRSDCYNKTSTIELYFQLGLAAKKAMRKYKDKGTDLLSPPKRDKKTDSSLS